MAMITRLQQASVVDYMARVNQQDFTPPDDATNRVISRVIDQSAQKVFNEKQTVLLNSPEHRAALAKLNASPRTCGAFRTNNAILEGYTAFEQMTALGELVDTKPNGIKKIHTFSFHSGDHYALPVTIKVARGAVKASKMTVVLGATCGALKAPCYSDWAKDDPLFDNRQIVFMDPLLALEMVRQPHCLASSMLKTATYYQGAIDHTWRYEVTNAKGDLSNKASVELKDSQDLKL